MRSPFDSRLKKIFQLTVDLKSYRRSEQRPGDSANKTKSLAAFHLHTAALEEQEGGDDDQGLRRLAGRVMTSH